MKKMARFVFALALLALASPAFSGLVPVDPEPAPPPPGPQYCWDVNNTSCWWGDVGQTISCTDGTWYDYSCTCYEWAGQYRWYCSEVR
jgi:hypothetical protein